MNEFQARYDKVFGKGCFEKLLLSQKKYSSKQFVRVNVSKTTMSDVESFFKKNNVEYSKTFLPNSFEILKSPFSLAGSLLSLTGDIYVQDIVSQVPVNAIDFNRLKNLDREVLILDMCSSPGSKTTQLCDLLEFYKIDFKLIALEPEKKRLLKLVNNIQKQEFSSVEVIQSFGEEFETDLKFDVILVDAPCSGNLIGDRSWLSKRDVNGILEKSAIQKKILKRASELLSSDNGELIYSTCSLEVEENEDNVLWAVENLGLKTKKINIEFPFSVKSVKGGSNQLRFMPYESKTQGFFVCCFTK